MPRPYYESQRGEAEYLLLHYGEADAPVFPKRCVTACLDPKRLGPGARALDLGCAVGRSTFELSRHCQEVIGIDFSHRFIRLARELQKKGSLPFQSTEEGELTQKRRAVVPKGLNPARVRFEQGDAMNLREDLGQFDIVLMANLIDRLPDPKRCLTGMKNRLRPGGQLIITSPYTWLTEYTPRKNWLGGFLRAGKPVRTFDALRAILSPDFVLQHRTDLSFLIREHARKFQLGTSDATVWRRKS